MVDELFLVLAALFYASVDGLVIGMSGILGICYSQPIYHDYFASVY